jgi:hypothetical protein
MPAPPRSSNRRGEKETGIQPSFTPPMEHGDPKTQVILRRKGGETRRFPARKNKPCFPQGTRAVLKPCIFSEARIAGCAAKSTRPVPAIQAGRLRGAKFAKPRVASRFDLSIHAGLLLRSPLWGNMRSRQQRADQRRLSLKHISPELYSRLPVNRTSSLLMRTSHT